MDKSPLKNVREDLKNPVLKYTWELFSQYELNAAVQQLLYKRMHIFC